MIEEEELLQGQYLKRIQRQLQQKGIGRNVPSSLLYRYTTADGLIGIIESRSIRATHFLYVNDRQEVVYADDLIHRVMADAVYYSDSLGAHVLHEISRTPAMSAGMDDTFIACFCEDGDLLSQWRAYGGRGGAYSLGLRATAEGLNRLNPRHVLYRVSYDAALLKDLVEFLLKAFCRDVEALHGTVPPDEIKSPLISMEMEGGKVYRKGLSNAGISELCIELSRAIAELACCFKSPHFASENEWRLVWRPDDQMPSSLSIRSAGGTLVPYVEIPLYLREPGHAALSKSWCFECAKVIYGPGLDSQRTERALQYLTAKFSPGVVIQPSKINVRL
jgi:hypothetical protein